MIEVLTGSNYKSWKEDIDFALGIVDIDFALRVDKPNDLTVESTQEQKGYCAQWERSNRLSLIAIKRTSSDTTC